MIKPWKIGVGVFVLSLFLSGWILSIQEPVEMVEVELVGRIGDETLEWIQSEYSGIRPSLWLQKENGDYRLMMTSGNDRFYQKGSPGTGRWLMESDQNKIILGEELVDRYFQRNDVIGSEMEFLGHTYEVVGIESGTSTIWIPYTELSEDTLDWDRRTLRYQIPNEDFEEVFISQLRQSFRRYGLAVLYVVNHSNWRWATINMALLVIMLFVWVWFYRKGKQTLKDTREFIHEYRLTHRLKSVSQYLNENRQGAKQLLMGALQAVAWGAAILFILRFIEVPASLRPRNFFSLAAYRDLMADWLDYFALNLRYGLSDFQIQAALLWLVCIGLGFVAQMIASRRRRRNG